ncbi:hypothetical protein SCHPADRAFT_939391 [Schizopora paradoxa]|uniref:Mid2 domain-containing protein n=1 Tax=Schizopora paradoxa TaxID=27342 RepID=A0A0H2RYM7_9AGAM|nr:hypothetical protein SCHPADRAFT_939391 [Schizopora paradoxa]
MTASTTHLDMGKRIALSVLIASIAPSIVAQNNCDDSDSDSSSDSDSDSDNNHSNISQHNGAVSVTGITTSRTSTASICTHTGSHGGGGSHSGSGTRTGTMLPASLTGTITSSAGLATSSSLQTSHNLTEDKHLGGGAIAGTIVGILVALLLMALLACFLRRRRRRQMYLADKSALRRRGGLLAAMEEVNTGGHDRNAHLEDGKELPSNPQPEQQQQQVTMRNIGHGMDFHIFYKFKVIDLISTGNADDRNTMVSMTQHGSTLLSYVPSDPPTSSTPTDSSVSNHSHDRSSYAVPPSLHTVPESAVNIMNIAESSATHDGLVSHQKELEASLHPEGLDNGSGSHLDDVVDPPPQYKEIL